MKTMLSTLNSSENLKIKELAVSAIGGIGECWNKFLNFILLRRRLQL